MVLLFLPYSNLYRITLKRKIKLVQTDWGGEFRSIFFTALIFWDLFQTPLSTYSSLNGRIERKHRHYIDIGFTLLAQAKLPLTFWWNAFPTVVYLISRLPTLVLNNQSLYFKLFKKQPDYSVLRVFGCSCFLYLRPYNKHKLEFKIEICIFIGYSSYHKGYQYLH